MVTAAGDLPSVKAAMAYGALDYVIKPFKGPRVKDALQRYRQRQHATQPDFSQSRLDRYLGMSFRTELPKGIESTTLERILDLLRTHSTPMSAEEVARHLGMSRTTAWRYLEHLLDSGRAELDFIYGAQGRPTKLYRSRA